MCGNIIRSVIKDTILESLKNHVVVTFDLAVAPRVGD
jgi:hypothetical protein